jgi:hypothetical protein
MAFESGPAPKSPSKRSPAGPIFAAGWRVFVDWKSDSTAATPVAPPDAGGAPVAFGDGECVEILGWRPRARDGLTYHVRRLSDGREGWILARHLRREARPTASNG